MAKKKNKNSNNKNNVAASKPSAIGAKETKDKIETSGISVDTSVLAALDKAEANLSAAQASKVDDLLSGLDKLVTSIKEEKDKAVIARKREDESLNTAKQKQDEADKVLKDLKKDKAEFEKQDKELLQKQNNLVNKERELSERESNAEAGFVKQNEASLEALQAEKEELRKDVQTLRGEARNAASELELKKTEAQSLLQTELHKLKITETEKLHQSLAEEKQALIQKLEKLSEDEATVEMLKVENSLTRKVLKQKQDSLEQLIQDSVAEKVAEIKLVNKHLQGKEKKSEERITSLLSEIDSYKDIRAALGDESPESILILNKELRKENGDLRRKLEGTPGEALQERYEDLKEEFEELEDAKSDQEREISKLKTELNKKKLYISEHQFSQQRLEMESLHKDMFGEKVKQLKLELNDLKEKDKDKQTFQALTEYDAKHQQRERSYGRQSHQSLNDFASYVQHAMARENFFYPEETIQLFIGGLAMSKLHILQGISGTGKTSLATRFAKVINGIGDRGVPKGLQVVPVQAGWRDGQDLTGYYNAFENRYYETDFLKGLYQAQTPEFKDKPYIILLDEMNLSHPEQYFAEFLSALELDRDGQVISLTSSSVANAPQHLIDGSKIQIPENVWFIGTANHDETTMEFADKTYDRSHVMELPRHLEDFQPKTTESCMWSFEDLVAAFEEAEQKHKKKVDIAHDIITTITNVSLEPVFDVGFGNRLKRQLNSFIPVVLETGASIELAIDHIIATKLLRKGKVTGRFDTSVEDIRELKETIEDIWKQNKFKIPATQSIKLLDKDLKRKGER